MDEYQRLGDAAKMASSAITELSRVLVRDTQSIDQANQKEFQNLREFDKEVKETVRRLDKK